MQAISSEIQKSHSYIFITYYCKIPQSQVRFDQLWQSQKENMAKEHPPKNFVQTAGESFIV